MVGPVITKVGCKIGSTAATLKPVDQLLERDQGFDEPFYYECTETRYELSEEAAITAKTMMRRCLREGWQEEAGQSMVELALTLPALLLVVTGLMAFGIAMNSYLILTDATAVGARQLTVSRGQTTDPCSTLSSAVYAAAPMLKRTSLTFNITLNSVPYAGTTCSGSSTSGAPSNMVLGTNAVVTVTYPFTLNMYGLKLSSAGSVLTAQTTELMQ